MHGAEMRTGPDGNANRARGSAQGGTSGESREQESHEPRRTKPGDRAIGERPSARSPGCRTAGSLDVQPGGQALEERLGFLVLGIQVGDVAHVHGHMAGEAVLLEGREDAVPVHGAPAGRQVLVSLAVVVRRMDVVDVAPQLLDAERQDLFLGVEVAGIQHGAEVVRVHRFHEPQESVGIVDDLPDPRF